MGIHIKSTFFNIFFLAAARLLLFFSLFFLFSCILFCCFRFVFFYSVPLYLTTKNTVFGVNKMLHKMWHMNQTEIFSKHAIVRNGTRVAFQTETIWSLFFLLSLFFSLLSLCFSWFGSFIFSLSFEMYFHCLFRPGFDNLMGRWQSMMLMLMCVSYSLNFVSMQTKQNKPSLLRWRKQMCFLFCWKFAFRRNRNRQRENWIRKRTKKKTEQIRKKKTQMNTTWNVRK